MTRSCALVAHQLAADGGPHLFRSDDAFAVDAVFGFCRRGHGELSSGAAASRGDDVRAINVVDR
jgi:hypothetical protein